MYPATPCCSFVVSVMATHPCGIGRNTESTTDSWSGLEVTMFALMTIPFGIETMAE